jgi:PAS domain S-box-containing protein
MPEHSRYARLARITQLINSNLDLQLMLHHVVTAISEEIVRCDSVGIYLPQSDGTFRGYIGKPDHISGTTIGKMIIDPATDYLARDIIETKKSIYISNTATDHRPDPRPIQLFKIKSLLGLPIFYGDELFGLVFLFDYGIPMNLSSSEIQAVEAYVNMAAVAIRNTKLLHHTQALLSEKQLLLDVTRELSLCSSTEEVLERSFYYLGQVLDNQNIGIHLCDSFEGKFKPTRLNCESCFTENDWVRIHEYSKLDYNNDPLFQEVLDSKQPILIPNIAEDVRPNKELCHQFGIRGLLVHPLVATGEVLGVIVVAYTHEVQNIQEVTIHLAQSVIDATATALSNVIRMEQLETMIGNRTTELSEKNERLKQALQENRLLSNKTELILNSAGEGIFGLDLTGHITFCNATAATLLDYEIEELIGISHDSITQQSISVNQKNSGEDFFIKKDGTTFPVDYVSTPLIEQGVLMGAVITYKDITERKKTEELIRKADKLSVIGELAAGVAHEIRNPLTSLKGFIQLLQSNNSNNQVYFEIMLSELDRINDIAGEFLFLSKPQASNFQYKDIVIILKNIVTLLHTQTIHQDIRVHITSSYESLMVLCAENQLKQAFINVLKNGIESMCKGGTIRISVKKKGQDKVSIRFLDQGVGIPEERIPLLGEPFYTTKEKGSGLGLMVSYKIIKDHKGDIKILSKKNKGTLVEVILPLS